MLRNDKINCNGSFRDITMYFVKDPCVNVSILWIIIMYHVKLSCCSTSKIHWDMSNFLVHLKASWNTVAWQCLTARQEHCTSTGCLQLKANLPPMGGSGGGAPRGRGKRSAARRRQPAPSLRHAPRDQAVTLHSWWLGAWAPPHPWGITNRGRGDKVTGDTQNLSWTQIVQQGHSRQGCTGGTLGSPLTASLPAECRQVINAVPNETLCYERERPPLPRHFQHHSALCTPCHHLPKQACVLMGDMETHLSQNGQYFTAVFQVQCYYKKL